MSSRGVDSRPGSRKRGLRIRRTRRINQVARSVSSLMKRVLRGLQRAHSAAPPTLMKATQLNSNRLSRLLSSNRLKRKANGNDSRLLLALERKRIRMGASQRASDLNTNTD